MGLTGTLFNISKQVCPHCKQTYGDSGGKKGHSKKQFMKCLYTANYNLYNAILENNALKDELIKLKQVNTPVDIKDGVVNG